jgi:integrase
MSDLKATLSDKVIGRLPLADKGQYIVRDADLGGFFLVVGTGTKTFTVQADYRVDGTRHSKRIAIGTTEEFNSRDARALAKAELLKIANRDYVKVEPPPKPAEVTLRQAWARYEIALRRKERSEATIKGYTDHVNRVMAAWLDLPLKTLGENPGMVSERHDELTANNGHAAANGCMRTLRAVYNHARRTARHLPADPPTLGVDWNPEKRRDTAMGAMDLPQWMLEAGRLRNPIRREFHLFTLLSGSRPTALKQAKVEHFDFDQRILYIPRPKGGSKRAFDIPLSREMIRCLVRAMRAGRMMHPEEAETWIFAADSIEGHLEEHKERREDLSKWGNDLRHSFRTLGQAAGLSEIDTKLLMNHSIPGVNAGYITRAKLLNDHLRAAQQKLSDFIVVSGMTLPKGAQAERVWPRLPSRRLGDERVDPTPPDPRLGVKLPPRRAQNSDAPVAEAA